VVGERALADVKIVRADYADPRHAADLVALLDAYARDPMGGGTPLPADTKARLVPELAQRPQCFSLLAYCDGEPAGLANCIEGFSTFAAKPLVNVHDIAVAPAFRRRGIARALLAAVDAEARARGCCKVTLEVLSGNAGAKAAYIAAGFAPYALDPEAGTAEFWEKALPL
jgi:ribosomal protein S18 acetylase RimI-like enzyme